jgi:hypothetical protein
MFTILEVPEFSAERQDIYRLRDDVSVLKNGHVYDAFIHGEQAGSVSVTVSAETAVVSKLCVAKGHRASTSAYPLATACIRDALKAGIRHLRLEAEPWLVSFYLRLGFRYCSQLANATRILVLDLQDEQNLHKLGSQFLKDFPARNAALMAA